MITLCSLFCIEPETLYMKKLLISICIILSYSVLNCLLITPLFTQAQFPYRESFKNTTVQQLVISGAAKLTAAAGIDNTGDGYLRLNDNAVNSVGYVHGINSFPSNYGLSASFEFFTYKEGATSTNQADGITFFLFDAGVNAFRPGGSGGSLGYAQFYTTPGVAKGYIGVSIDEFGNFSSAVDGAKNGGPGQRKSSVAIRGPGNGKSTTDYVYQTGVSTTDNAYNVGFSGFSQRYPDSTNTNYRKIKIIINPGSSLGTDTGCHITVIMYRGGVPVSPVTLINNFDYPFAAPAKLQFGLSASTGSITDFHEIRDLNIEAANISALIAPIAKPDSGIITCRDQTVLIDLAANDSSLNKGGNINKLTIDLDPLTAGRQTSFIDAGKGTYAIDSNGVVSFTPLAGFTGTSMASYKVADTYGIVTSSSAQITVKVNDIAGPVLSLLNPPATCSPSTVDITDPVYRVQSSPGAAYTYFSSLSDATFGKNEIISSAAALLNSTGVYYIKATLAGCATIKPVMVQVSAPPSAANAGIDQNLCNSAGADNTTLLASNPEMGKGLWIQVNGPSVASIVFPGSATTPVGDLEKGVYQFRWTTSNGTCPQSADDIKITVGIISNAGADQAIVNATSTTLSASVAAPGTGVWALISGPSIDFTQINNPGTEITGLIPGTDYILEWKVTNGACTSTSQIAIKDVLNTLANAGPDQFQADFTNVHLDGNSPAFNNTGKWSIIDAPAGSTALIIDAASATAVLGSINKAGDYILRWTISNGNFSNYDDVVIRIGGTLPVTWLSFTGVQENMSVQLRWTTASELNIDHFILESSSDAVHFSAVGKTAAVNKPNGAKYNYVVDVSNFNDNAIYYRLISVDKNQGASFSPVIKIMLRRQSTISVHPNPVKNLLFIKIPYCNAGVIESKIYNMNGGLIKTVQQRVAKGYNQLLIEGVEKLAGGMYYLELTGAGVHYTRKIEKW